MKKHLELCVISQGIQGGNSKDEKKGYAILSIAKDGTELCEIAIDTYEGVGDYYRERKEPQIVIMFPGDHGLNFVLTVERLKKILLKQHEEFVNSGH